MTKVEKLVDFVHEKYGIRLDVNSFQRTRAGHWQRSKGAWSWWMTYAADNPRSFGSQNSVTEILKNKDRIVLYNGNELIVENE